MSQVAIIIHSCCDHLDTLAMEIQRGVQESGGHADIYCLESTIVGKITNSKQTVSKKDFPMATKDTLTKYDGFLFGIPTRSGTLPAEWSAFWDRTGGLWFQGALGGKMAGLFTSTPTYAEGQEGSMINFLSYLVHHGLIFVPLGYKNNFETIANISELHGACAWGAGTISGTDGLRLVTELEKEIAHSQGREFYAYLNCFNSKSISNATASSKKSYVNKANNPAAPKQKSKNKNKNKNEKTRCSIM